MRWLKNQLREKLNNNQPLRITESDLGVLGGTGGGYQWSCDGINAMGSFFHRSDVQEAMHLDKPGGRWRPTDSLFLFCAFCFSDHSSDKPTSDSKNHPPLFF